MSFRVYRGMFSFDILQLLVLRAGGWCTGFRASGIAGAASWCRCCSCRTARGTATTTCWRFARGTTGRPGKKRREIRHVTSSAPAFIPDIMCFFFSSSRLPSLLNRAASQNHLDSVKELLKRNLTIFFIRCISLRNIIIIVTRKACNFKVINVLVFTVSFFYVIISESKFFYAHLIYIFCFFLVKFLSKR